MERKIVNTNDGSKTLFLPDMNEQYHSINGAITESEYVYLKQGFNHHPSINPVVFEVGFGTGLNALLTALQAEIKQRKTTYITIEDYPLDTDTIKKLNYGRSISKKAEELFTIIHQAEWHQSFRISEFFELFKIKDDFKAFSFDNLPTFDVIYFDAFGPDKQPEMWQENLFAKIGRQCISNSNIVTYSAKGEIRRRIERCGFRMERLPGPPGKRQMLRGIKW